jgi:hypothetical protein
MVEASIIALLEVICLYELDPAFVNRQGSA